MTTLAIVLSVAAFVDFIAMSILFNNWEQE